MPSRREVLMLLLPPCSFHWAGWITFNWFQYYCFHCKNLKRKCYKYKSCFLRGWDLWINDDKTRIKMNKNVVSLFKIKDVECITIIIDHPMSMLNSPPDECQCAKGLLHLTIYLWQHFQRNSLYPEFSVILWNLNHWL